jgi:hypothetical protein
MPWRAVAQERRNGFGPAGSRIRRDRKREPGDCFGGVERLRLVGGSDDQVRQRVCLPERVVSRIGPRDQTHVGTGLKPVALISKSSGGNPWGSSPPSGTYRGWPPQTTGLGGRTLCRD